MPKTKKQRTLKPSQYKKKFDGVTYYDEHGTKTKKEAEDMKMRLKKNHPGIRVRIIKASKFWSKNGIRYRMLINIDKVPDKYIP
jgi:hypothetical protein